MSDCSKCKSTKTGRDKHIIHDKDCEFHAPDFPWPDPKPEDLDKEDFNLIWECIKTWDINVPEAYEGYTTAEGNHVMQILFATGKRNITDYC